MVGNFKSMLLKAKTQGYAVPAFNFDNLDILKAIIQGAEAQKSPVILMATESAVMHMGKDYVEIVAKRAIEKAKVPAILHLDHCFDPKIIKNGINNHWQSVMLDWSKYEIKENTKKTKEIVSLCHPLGIYVESEIGHVGGKEDDYNSDKVIFTNPEEAVKFVNDTNVDALAISVGTQHGEYNGPITLQIPLIRQIARMMETPLVLHGSSGVPADMLQEAIKAGITKVNIGTDLKIAYAQSLRQSLTADPHLYDARKFGSLAIIAVQKVVEEKIIILGSKNRG